MDQYLIAMCAVVAFALFCLGYYIGACELESRRREPTEFDPWLR